VFFRWQCRSSDWLFFLGSFPCRPILFHERIHERVERRRRVVFSSLSFYLRAFRKQFKGIFNSLKYTTKPQWRRLHKKKEATTQQSRRRRKKRRTRRTLRRT